MNDYHIDKLSERLDAFEDNIKQKIDEMHKMTIDEIKITNNIAKLAFFIVLLCSLCHLFNLFNLLFN